MVVNATWQCIAIMNSRTVDCTVVYTLYTTLYIIHCTYDILYVSTLYICTLYNAYRADI